MNVSTPDHQRGPEDPYAEQQIEKILNGKILPKTDHSITDNPNTDIISPRQFLDND